MNILAFMCIVTVSISEQTKQQPDIQILDNFHHLFNSISKNDPAEINKFRSALREEAGKEKEAFNAFRGGLKNARGKNIIQNESKNSPVKRNTDSGVEKPVVPRCEFGAIDVKIERKYSDVSEEKPPDESAAHQAAAKDEVDVLKHLLQHNESLFRLRDRKGLTIFLTAAQNGAINSVRYLIDESRADIDPFEPVDDGSKNSALHLAAENGHVEVLKYLVEEKGADVNAQNKLQQPPAFFATDWLQFEAVKYLIGERNADPTITDWNRNNILHRAAVAGGLEIPKFLFDDLKVAIDVNDRNDFGETALLLAVKFNKTLIVMYLVEEKEANVNIPDIQYRTPLYHAAFFGYLNLVKYLVEHGADIERRDEHGNGPIETALTDAVKRYLKKKSTPSRGNVDATSGDMKTLLRPKRSKNRPKSMTYSPIQIPISYDLEREKVVPDVVPTPPNALLKVGYNNVYVQLGNEMTPSKVKFEPTVHWESEAGNFYTLIMVVDTNDTIVTDPDAPDPKNPTQKEVLHWLVVNIPGVPSKQYGIEVGQGEVLAEYVGSGPPKNTGYHRYVFMAYKQPGKLKFDEKYIPARTREGRTKFMMKRFAEKYKLGNPIAGNVFKAQFDDWVPTLEQQFEESQ